MERKKKQSSVCRVHALRKTVKKCESEFYSVSSSCEHSRVFVVSFSAMSEINRHNVMLRFGRDTPMEMFRGTINGYSQNERNIDTADFTSKIT
jgi:hypothetical protein